MYENLNHIFKGEKIMDKKFKKQALDAMIASCEHENQIELQTKIEKARCMFPEEFDAAFEQTKLTFRYQMTNSMLEGYLKEMKNNLKPMIEDIEDRASYFGFLSVEDMCMWYIDTFEMKFTSPKISKIVGNGKIVMSHWFRPTQKDFDSDWEKAKKICKIMFNEDDFDYNIARIMKKNFGWRGFEI